VTYEYQMQVYAALFKLRNGVYLRRAVLYFFYELDEDSAGDPYHIVYLTEDKINTALKEFDQTAGLIQQYKLANTWNPLPSESLSILKTHVLYMILDGVVHRILEGTINFRCS
jgi:hypothetical protein